MKGKHPVSISLRCAPAHLTLHGGRDGGGGGEGGGGEGGEGGGLGPNSNVAMIGQ